MAKRVVGNIKIAVAYLRVSTSDQALGPEAQRAQIITWAAREGVTVASWHIDQGVCGATPLDERPALVEALSALGVHGAGVLIIAKRDRLARDVATALAIEGIVSRSGATVATADGVANGDGPGDRLMRTMLDAFAEHERALIRARTKAALAVKRAKGEYLGAAPFGMRLAADGVHLESDPGESAIVDAVYALAGEGLSTRAIVAGLARRGYVGRTGKPLGQTAVQRLLARRRVEDYAAE